jgi:hypothetical protein
MAITDLPKCTFCSLPVLGLHGQDTFLPEWILEGDALESDTERVGPAHLTCLVESGLFNIWRDRAVLHTTRIRRLIVEQHGDYSLWFNNNGGSFVILGGEIRCEYSLIHIEKATSCEVTMKYPYTRWHIADYPEALKYFRSTLGRGLTCPLIQVPRLLGVEHCLRDSLIQDGEIGPVKQTQEYLAIGHLSVWCRHRVEIPEPVAEPILSWLRLRDHKVR